MRHVFRRKSYNNLFIYCNITFMQDGHYWQSGYFSRGLRDVPLLCRNDIMLYSFVSLSSIHVVKILWVHFFQTVGHFPAILTIIMWRSRFFSMACTTPVCHTVHSLRWLYRGDTFDHPDRPSITWLQVIIHLHHDHHINPLVAV